MERMTRVFACFPLGLGCLLPACGDPVPDATVATLGPEDPNVPQGPSHRPGQPCILCHQTGGGARAFSLGGTVYADVASQKVVGGVSVFVLDTAKATFSTTTNCAGNFFVPTEQFVPTYPIWLTLRAGKIQRDMASPAYREGSCAGCHTSPVGPSSPGHVYVIEDPTVDILPANPQCP
jgi:hypothetical protein